MEREVFCYQSVHNLSHDTNIQQTICYVVSAMIKKCIGCYGSTKLMWGHGGGMVQDILTICSAKKC